jgi:hypothetical protein
MTRYIKQRDRYNCAPVAIINALKWAGEKATYSELNRLKELCKCKSPEGTWSDHFHTALGKEKGLINSRQIKNPSLTEINEWLDKGNAVIVLYNWWKKTHYKKINQYATKKVPGDWNGHYILISKRFPGQKEMPGLYMTHNNGRSRGYWSREEIRHYLGNGSYVWFIRKR